MGTRLGQAVHIGKKGRMDSSVTMETSSLEELLLHGRPLPPPDHSLNAKWAYDDRASGEEVLGTRPKSCRF